MKRIRCGNLFLAYQRSGDKRYRDLAVRFIYHEYYDALAETQCPSRQARVQSVNTLSSAMQAYLVLGKKISPRCCEGLRMVQERATPPEMGERSIC